MRQMMKWTRTDGRTDGQHGNKSSRRPDSSAAGKNNNECVSKDANTFDKYLAEYLFAGGGLVYASSIVFDGELKGSKKAI